MTNEEIIEFINCIKQDYPNFNFENEDEYKVWKDSLSNASKDVVYAKYEEHKRNENFKKNPPNVKIFVFDKNERKTAKKFLEECRWCKRVYYHETMMAHESRHKSIDYIKSRTKKYFNSEITKEKEEQMLMMTDVEFNNKYDTFLEKLISVTSGVEQKNLMIIKYTREHPNLKININFENIKEVIGNV